MADYFDNDGDLISLEGELYSGADTGTDLPQLGGSTFNDDDLISLDGQLYSDKSDEYVDERGEVMDTVFALGRGITRATELVGEAGERIGISNPFDEWSASIRDKYLKPDESQYYGEESWLKRGWTGAIESLPTTGAVIGLTMLGPILVPAAGTTAAIALGGTALGIIGAGTDQQAQEEYLKVHPGDYEGAKIHGAKTGGSEVMSELLSDVVPFAGKLFKFGGKQGIKTLREMVGPMSKEEIGARIAATYATEGSTELANAAYQAHLNNVAGISDVTPGKAALEAAGPVLFMGGALSAATVGMTYKERANVRRGLSIATSPENRKIVAKSVAKALDSRIGKEESTKWLEVANYNIDNNLDISIDPRFDEVYASMEKHKESVSQMDPLTEDAAELDASVAAKLEEKEPIARVNKFAVGEAAATRIEKATDEELKRMSGTDFTKSVATGRISNEEAVALNKLLADRLAKFPKEAIPKAVVPRPEGPRAVAVPRPEAPRVIAEEQVAPVFTPVERKEAFDTEARVAEILEEGKAKELAAETPQARANKVGATIALEEAQKLNEAIDDKRFKADMANTIKLGMANVDQYTNELAAAEDINEIQRIQRVPTKVLNDVSNKAKAAKKSKQAKIATTTNLAEKQKLRKDIQKIDKIQQGAVAAINKQIAEIKVIPTDTLGAKVGKLEEVEKLDVEKAAVAKVARGKKQVEAAKLREVKEQEVYESKAEADVIRAAIEAKDTVLATQLTKNAILKSKVGKDLSPEEVDLLVAEKIRKDTLSIKEELKEPVVLDVEELDTGIAIERAPIKEKAVVDAKLTEWEGNLKDDGFIIGKGVDKSDWFITKKDNGNLEITSPTIEKAIIVPKSKNVQAKAKQLVNSRVALTDEGKSALAGAKKRKVASTTKRKISAYKVATGFKGLARTGTIDGVKHTLTNIAKGKGKGWYLKGDEKNPKLKIGDTKAEAILHLKSKGTMMEPKGAAPIKIYTKEEKDNLLMDRDQAPIAEAKISEASDITGKQLLEINLSSDNPFIRSFSRDLLASKKIADKLENKLVKVGTTDRSFVWDGKLIFMSDTKNSGSNLHEVMHSITVGELKEYPHIAKQVKDLMGAVRRESVAQGLFTSEQMEQISKDNKEDWNADGIFYTDENLSKNYGVSYALRNEKEFLAQIFDDVNVRNLLEDTDLTNPKGRIRTAWDKFVQIIQKVLGLPNSQYTNLHKIIDLTFELAESPVKDVDSVVDIKPSKDETGAVVEVDRAPLAKAPLDTAATLEILKETSKPTILAGPKEFMKGSLNVVKKLGMPLTDRLREIDPKLVRVIRTMELNISREGVKAAKTVKLFSDFYKKLSANDQALLNWALKNNDKESVRIRKNIVGDDLYKDVEKLLKYINRGHEEVGLNSFSAVDNYFPRKVKDVEGLMQHMSASRNIKSLEKKLGRKATKEEKANITEQAKSVTLIEESLLQAQNKKGAPLTPPEKAEIINSIMNTGSYNAISFNVPSSAAARSIKRVTPEMDKYYENSMDALVTHVYESIEAIETRKAFNFTNRKKLTRKGTKLAKEITKKSNTLNRLNDKKVKSEVDTKRIKKLEIELKNDKTKLESTSNDLKALNEDTTESVSQFLAEQGLKLTTEQQKEVVRIFKARLDQKGTYGVFSNIRDAVLMSTLGNPMAGVTQLQDLLWAVYKNGPINTASSIFSTLTGKSRITKNDFDLEKAMGDFTSNKKSKWVDRVLTASGLKHMDLFGKNVFLESSIKKAESMTKEQFIKEQSEALGDNAGKVYDKIKGGKWRDKDGTIDAGVQYYAFNALSDVQPISLSEMSEGFLGGGQARIFWLLKSYPLKQLNAIIREFRKPGPKNKAKALALVTLLTFAGAGVDEIKDWMLGREVTFKDHVYDNLLKIAFLSKYSLESSRTGKAIITDLVIPPTGLLDYTIEDIGSMFDKEPGLTFAFKKNLPYGRLWYAHTAEGQKKSLENEKKAISKDFKNMLREKGNLSGIRKRINALNKKVRGTAVKPINYIKSRKRYINEIRKESRK